MKQTISNRSRAFFREHRAILIVMLLLLIERIIAMLALSYEYTLKDDDWAYVISGIVFANTGTIIMHGDLSAQIMPGMPVFLGLISLIFGEGRLYLLVVKILWTLMGTFTAYFIYRSVCLFAPKWCGVVAALPLFAPNLVWLDQLVLTETPYIFCSAAMIYFTLQMGKSEKKRYFWLCALCYLLTLMLKANAGVYPLFAAIYLLLVRYDWKKLLRQGVILVCLTAALLTPWTIRNEKLFHAFIPLTYGSGNPMLLGTYQGEGWPEDDTLDYAANVDAPMAEKFADYYDENGNVREDYYIRYLMLERDAIRAKYRMREWIKRDPCSFFRAYLMDKPGIMVNRVYYEQSIFGTTLDQLNHLRYFFSLLVTGLFFLAFVLKRRRSVMLFLALVYTGNIFIYSFTLAYQRYGQTLTHIWYIMLGIGLPLLIEAGKRAVRACKTLQR